MPKKTYLFFSLVVGVFFLVKCTSENPKSATTAPTAGGADCSTVCEPAPSAGETAATIPAGIVGTHSLTLQYAGATSPYTNGTAGTFVIGADNTLQVTIDGACITLKNPITRTSSVEFVFKDSCNKNLEYQVSVTPSGGLNEVNYGPVGGGYHGQFH